MSQHDIDDNDIEDFDDDGIDSGDDGMGEVEEDDREYGYILVTRDGEQIIQDRDEAVQMAKDATIDNMQSATLDREDGQVRMQFRQGGLFVYVYETRKGRKA